MSERKIVDWFTMNGKHIPIFEGESKQDAINRSIARDNEDKKNKDIENAKKQAEKAAGKSSLKTDEKEQKKPTPKKEVEKEKPDTEVTKKPDTKQVNADTKSTDQAKQQVKAADDIYGVQYYGYPTKLSQISDANPKLKALQQKLDDAPDGTTLIYDTSSYYKGSKLYGKNPKVYDVYRKDGNKWRSTHMAYDQDTELVISAPTNGTALKKLDTIQLISDRNLRYPHMHASKIPSDLATLLGQKGSGKSKADNPYFKYSQEELSKLNSKAYGKLDKLLPKISKAKAAGNTQEYQQLREEYNKIANDRRAILQAYNLMAYGK